MDGFIQKYQPDVTGVLHGWDRLMIRGTVRALAVASGMMSFLGHVGVLLKNFGQYVQDRSEHVKQACLQMAEQLNRPVQYLPSSQARKEDIAAGIAAADGIADGLVCLLTCVEPCRSYSIRRDRASKKLLLELGVRKCLHIYHYWVDRDFGLMHARLQTWFPFTIQVCLNGRSWLARQMDRAGLAYRQQENCFVWLEDAAKAQQLMAGLLRWDWPTFLGAIARRIHPGLSETLEGYRADYYWSAYETEWASDVMFDSPKPLAAIYPSLARGAIVAFSGDNVLRFLGRKMPADSEITSHYGRRVEGVRVKHSVGSNSVKMYDKQGSVLRVETTINDPRSFRVYRVKEAGSSEASGWQRMRKGVVDLRRRAEISQGCNDRYYAALAALDTSRPLREFIEPVCRPVRMGSARLRGLRPWLPEDLAVLREISRAEHALEGFRNRHLLHALYPSTTSDPADHRRRSARVSYRLRLLRAHHIIKKVPRTHRYQLTPEGRRIVTAILQTQEVSLAQLAKLVA